ncbi:ankyrin unc44 [Colletotrichum kahawae]|uniref:Ankyrin unc44 n=1 Tax=Colletotrichum kahawae TaxID=34407 RepID=A0AAD9Y8Q3_COLKA|nr:ankyrin unc44 [Colletotrichum kahawae]
MLSMGMQSILDSLMRLKSVVTALVGGSYSVRDRLRWAMLDKKKERNLLQDAQIANDELSIMLQILTTRLSSLNQNSLAALNAGQSFMIQSLDDIKDILSTNMTQLIVRTYFSQIPSREPAEYEKAAIPGRATAKSTTHEITSVNVYPAQQECEIDPGYMLMQHNRNLTRKYLIAKFGNTERPESSFNGSYSTRGNLTLELKMKSQKARFLFSMCFQLLGHHILRFELQAQLLCRLWKFDPSLTASLTIVNVRPSDTPIFVACRNWDLQEVHYLLETRKAGINDTNGDTGGLLEIAGLDPNQPGGLNRKPIGNAAQELWIEGIAILLQYGAHVNVNEWDWNGTPLHRSTKPRGILTDASHYLLRQGADPKLKDGHGLSWLICFTMIRIRLKLLFPIIRAAVALESLNGSKFPYMYLRPDYFRDKIPEDFLRQFEMMDYDRSFDWTFEWNDAGEICWSSVNSSASELAVANTDSLVLDDELEEDWHKNVNIKGEDSEYGIDEYITEEGKFVSCWAYKDSLNHDFDPDSELRFALNGASPGFFRNATAFHRHTATLQGQRQLSRWPMVRALCDGLQHAGYRVEMDDDGDLWYDCDDGDRYFDAWETQPAEERDDWLVDVCPICQNFDKYGLGHVLDIEHKAVEKVQDYRRQVQEGKRKYF